MATASEMQAKVDKTVTNMDRIDDFTNGGPTTTVTLDGGVEVPSIQKLIEDTGYEAGAAATAVAAAAVAVTAAEGVDAVNLWPDLDFNLSQDDQAFAINGFRLHSQPFNNKTWNGEFVGPSSKGAWVYDPGSAQFMGFDLFLSGPGFKDAGIVEGDVVSVAAEITAASGTVLIAVRWFSNAGASSYTWVTTQQGAVTSPSFNGDTKVLKTQNLTVPSGATGLAVYLVDVVSSAFNLTRLWVVKGSTVSDTPPLRITPSQRDATIETIVRDTADRVAYIVNEGFDYSSEDPQIVATSKSITLRTATFTGWGDVLDPAGVSFNAIRFTTASHSNPGGGATTLNVVIRAGASGTAHTTGAPIVAVGSTEISADNNVFTNVIIPLRDLTTGAFKTLTDADLSDEYFIGYWFGSEAGSAVGYCSGMRGTMPNRVSPVRSYFSSQTNPQAGSWLDYGSDGPIALDHVLLADLDTTLVVSNQALEYIGERIGDGTYGPIPNVYNAAALRQYAKRITAGEARTIAVLGDSWTNTAYRLFTPLRARFLASSGISGPGYSSINTGISGTTDLTRSRSGTWTNVRSSTAAIGPDNAHATTTDTSAGAVYTPATAVTTWLIHYLQQPNGGSFTYQVGSGSVITVNTAGTLAYQIVSVSGSGTDALTLDVTVAGGAGVTIAGVEARATASGQVLMHKLGAGGARASHYAGMGAGYLEAAYGSLAPDVVIIALGTNDHAANAELADFKDQLGTIVTRVRTNAPLADILLLGTGPNDTSALLPITDYIRQVYEVAVEQDCAFINLQAGFGTYSEALARGLFEDSVDPNTAGGLIIARTIWRGVFAE